jgi:hypothetical protein
VSGRYVSLVFASDLAPDLKFTAAVLASFADEHGYRIWPAVGEVAYLRGLKERQVQVHMKDLRAMRILETVKPATQWFPAHYRMVPEKLPARAPYQPPERQPYLLGPPGESPPDHKSGVQSAAPLPGVQSSVPGVQPTAPDPSLSRDPSQRTHSTGVREAGTNSEVQPTAPLKSESPSGYSLPLVVAPTRDPDHVAHAWCGRICVPKFLHKQFKRALGGQVTKRAARLRTFYAETLAAIPAARPIDPDPVKFWRPAFAAKYSRSEPAPVTRRPGVRGGNCPHDPICDSPGGCFQRVITDRQAGRTGTE